MHEIDLNADIGESFGAWEMGNDAALVARVSSANIACGFHAGDADVMARSVALCKQHGVAIGAHPSFPDRQGFGRRAMALSPSEVYHAVLYQIGALAAFVRAQDAQLRHVKPHGALYNMAVRDRPLADAIAQAVHDFDATLALVGLPDSELIVAGRARGLRTLAEGFADRRYTAEGTLVPRSQPGALIEDALASERQVLQMVFEQCVTSIDGVRIALQVDTLCLHGDGVHAVAFAEHLARTLRERQVAVRASAHATKPHLSNIAGAG